MPNIISNNRFSIFLHEEGYYELQINDDVEIDIDDVKEIVKAQKKLSGKRLPTLISAAGQAITNVETLSYLSKNENFPYSKAGAYVVTSASQRLLANFYLKLKHPERPTRFFDTKDEAVKWVLEQRDKE
ncbi:MAG: hypothetical protein Q8M29_03365 [Bacteroidota bacterium]|nr:hypothetical protein [Bacteroidota bacterium]